MTDEFELQILLPVHNEEGCIADTIQEIYAEISPQVRMQFIICEDGSVDGTKTILTELGKKFPMLLLMSEERKGYSRAVRDGMLAATAPYLLCLDSDGQCDPRDFRQFWEKRSQADVLIGWRTQRADTLLRKTLSRTFYLVYKCFFPVPIHDPSCPFILVPDTIVKKLAGKMAEMQQGFWWEFTARVFETGYKFLELPIHHRERTAGKTQVYHLKKMPGIGIRHFLALIKIKQNP
jgi:dolichol-phosphate mannosyltransferase